MKSMTEEVDAELGETSSESENEDDEKGSDTEGEGEIQIEDKPISEIRKQVEEPVSEGDREANKRLLAKLKAGESDTDDEEDEKLRNGDIDSRKRKFEAAGINKDDDGIHGPVIKRSPLYNPNDQESDDGEKEEDGDGNEDDSDDEMINAVESQL